MSTETDLRSANLARLAPLDQLRILRDQNVDQTTRIEGVSVRFRPCCVLGGYSGLFTVNSNTVETTLTRALADLNWVLERPLSRCR